MKDKQKRKLEVLNKALKTIEILKLALKLVIEDEVIPYQLHPDKSTVDDYSKMYILRAIDKILK